MESAEASGKTVEDALNRALAQLGANRDEIEFVVLDEGQKGGLFGRGAREARVRVDRLTQPLESDGEQPLPDTRIPRATSGRTGAPRQGGGRPSSGSPSRGGRERGGPRPGGGGSRPGPRQSTRTGFDQPAPRLTEQDFLRAPSFEESSEAAASPLAPGREPDNRERRDAPRPTRGRRSDGPSEAREPREPRRRREREDEPVIEPDINAEDVDFAAQVLDDLLQILDINADKTIREPLSAGDGRGSVLAVIDISGEDLGLLIGRRGDTLAAIQYLLNLIVGRRFPGRGGVSIDVEHYKHRREEQILSLANRMADRVRETGSPITLEPMSAAERRLVHLTFADDEDLQTNSIGEGENRKVVISSRHS